MPSFVQFDEELNVQRLLGKGTFELKSQQEWKMYEIFTYKNWFFIYLHNELDGQIPRPNTFTGNHLGDMKLKFASGASLSPLFTPAYIYMVKKVVDHGTFFKKAMHIKFFIKLDKWGHFLRFKTGGN